MQKPWKYNHVFKKSLNIESKRKNEAEKETKIQNEQAFQFRNVSISYIYSFGRYRFCI